MAEKLEQPYTIYYRFIVNVCATQQAISSESRPKAILAIVIISLSTTQERRNLVQMQIEAVSIVADRSQHAAGAFTKTGVVRLLDVASALLVQSSNSFNKTSQATRSGPYTDSAGRQRDRH